MHNREPAVSASFQEMRTVLDTLPPDGYNRDVAERLFVMDWQNLGKALAVSRYLARAKTYD
jgi:outer membrane protein assembly factor BamD (BamD/ComL family)